MTLPCPPQAALEQFLRGNHTGIEFADLETQIADCTPCRLVLDRLTTYPVPNDTLSDVLPLDIEVEWRSHVDQLHAALLGHLRDLLGQQ